MKTLITFGCSFTATDGEILFREFEVPKKYVEPHKSWSVELARLTNSDIVNRGKGGVGNYYITNRI